MGGQGGGAGTATAAPAWISGARLRAHLIDGGAGAAHFLGWQDTLLGTPCAFATTSAGVFCLPPPGSVSAGAYFTDAACTQPTLVVEGTGAVEGSYAEVPADACDPFVAPPRRTLVTVGPPRDAAGLWTLVGGGTEAACVAAAANGVYHQVTALAAPPFVQGTVTVRQAGGAGSPHVVAIEGSDGSHENFGFFDAERLEACTLSAGRYGDDGLCLPANAVFGEGPYFSDLACQHETIVVGAPCMGSLYGVEFPRTYQCAAGSLPRAVRILQLDPTLLAPSAALSLASPTSGACEPYTGLPLSGAFLQAVVSEYAVSAFPFATPVRVGTGRLAAQLHAGGDGSVVHESPSPFGVVPYPYRFWDTALQVECAPRQTAAGSLRCLPEGACPAVEFTDPECRLPGIGVSLDAACDPPRYAVQPCDDSAPATDVALLGPAQPAYDQQTGACVAVSAGARAPGVATTTPVSLQTFAVLVDRIE